MARAQERYPRVGGLALHPIFHRQVLGDDQARERKLEEVAHPAQRLLVLEGGKIADLGVPEDLKPVLVDVFGEAAQRQPGLLDARADHAAIETALAAEQLEAQIEVLVLEQLLDRDRVHRPRKRNTLA